MSVKLCLFPGFGGEGVFYFDGVFAGDAAHVFHARAAVECNVGEHLRAGAFLGRFDDFKRGGEA